MFFLHTGDLHYSDIETNDVNLYREAFKKVMGASRQNQWFRSVPIAYIWDDHDFGPNDANRTSPSREAAITWYHQEVPHYPLALGNNPKTPAPQAFSVGRVRFIMSDLRSARDPKGTLPAETKSMMSKEPLAWFKKEVVLIQVV